MAPDDKDNTDTSTREKDYSAKIYKIKHMTKKEWKAYKKMHKKHKKELVKLAKADYEWDWGFLHELVITKIRHMYEYYKAGNHVFQSNETLLPLIDELKHILDLQNELDHLYDNVPKPQITRNESGSLTVTYNDEVSSILNNVFERKIEIYKEIYTYIGENLLGWWD